MTTDEWVSSVVFYARTNWRVIYNITLSVNPTGSGAGIHALLPYTSQITGTLEIGSAFRSTIRWSTNVLTQARTRWCAANVYAL